MKLAAAALWAFTALTPVALCPPGAALAGEIIAGSGLRDDMADRAIGLMLENPGPGQAETLLGLLYLRGARLESDPVAAGAWLERAAANGHPAGIYAAARLYAEGVGVPADPERARRLLAGADPARFGGLADQVRQLMATLDIAPPPAPAEPAVEPVPPAEPPPAEPVIAAAPPPAPAPVSDGGPVAQSATVGGFIAQLATVSSFAGATSEAKRLLGRLPEPLIIGRALITESVRTADGRTVWRVSASGFADRAAARSFCDKLIAAGYSCLPRGRQAP